MKIAILISGRATRYESCLLRFLQSQDNVVNDIRKENLPNTLPIVDIKTVDSLEDIPIILNY